MIKAVVCLAMFLTAMPVFAEEVPVGRCTLSMNIDNLSLQVTSYNTDVDDAFSIDYTAMSDSSGNRSLASIVKYINPKPINTLESSLVRFMNDRGCFKVTGDCWKTGYIADGIIHGGKRRYWGVAFPLDLDNSTYQFTRGLIFIACFEDRDLNERLAKEVRAEDLRCPG